MREIISLTYRPDSLVYVHGERLQKRPEFSFVLCAGFVCEELKGRPDRAALILDTEPFEGSQQACVHPDDSYHVSIEDDLVGSRCIYPALWFILLGMRHEVQGPDETFFFHYKLEEVADA